MKKPDTGTTIYDVAREAIDEDALARVLELAAGEGCEDDVVGALREVTTDEIVANSLAAAAYARRRGRFPTPEDIGDAADQRRDCCQPSDIQWEFKHAWFET